MLTTYALLLTSMITIIHGEDITKSRKYFIEQRQQYHDAVTVSGATVTLTEIVQIFEGNELFATEKHIFIEEFFSKRRKSKETDQIFQLIKDNHKDSTVFFWESKDLSPAQLSNLPADRQVKQFKLPQIIFNFLDSVKPKNGRKLIHLFHETLQDEEAQFIFSMIVRQFRLLLALANVGANNLPRRQAGHLPLQLEELKRMSPWQKSKLEKQASAFSIEQLKTAYTKLYQIEFGAKTGSLNLSLEQAIDFWLITL